MTLALLTAVHVLFSLAGLVSGTAIVGQFLLGSESRRWTTTFFLTMVGTDVSGFLFPTHRFLPSHALGILSLAILGVAWLSRPRVGAQRPRSRVYAVTITIVLYLDVFVAVVQAFLKSPRLHALAPTQTEPAFKFTQFVVLLIFVAIGFAAIVRSRSVAPNAQ